MELGDAFFFIGGGLAVTFRLLIGGFILGISLGTAIAIARQRGKVGKNFATAYVSIIRGTPLLLQLGIIYFSFPGLLGIRLGIIGAGILAFGVNSSAYVSEILRSGIESIPKGQMEAAKTLKIPRFYMWKDIILPQVMARIFPAMVGEVIALLKETALIATIGGADLMRKSQMFAAEKFNYFIPLCIAGLYYYAIVLSIEWGARKLERKMVHAKG
ncbi:MAG: amino acid ABC transporter permease [Puniceicoccales bacterium]|nr:amino acid ABC transporter permease [Puniceicoccales bacterium]